MDKVTNEDIEKVINLRPLIQKRLQKKCNCKDRTFTVDLENREVICNRCGQIVEPFEALVELSRILENEENYLKQRYEVQKKLDKWLVNHKEPIAIKPFIENYRRGLRPYCPHCHKMIDIYNVKRWGDRMFLERFCEEETKEKEAQNDNKTTKS